MCRKNPVKRRDSYKAWQMIELLQHLYNERKTMPKRMIQCRPLLFATPKTQVHPRTILDTMHELMTMSQTKVLQSYKDHAFDSPSSFRYDTTNAVLEPCRRARLTQIADVSSISIQHNTSPCHRFGRLYSSTLVIFASVSLLTHVDTPSPVSTSSNLC